MTDNRKSLHWIAGLTLLALLFLAAPVCAQSLPHRRVDDDAATRNFREVQRWLSYFEHVNRSVFQAVDTTGGQSIADDDSAYITLDKEVIEGNIYVHAADDYAVGITQDGVFEISYNVCATTVTGTSGLITTLCRYSSSWLNVAGTLMENPANNVAHASTSATKIMTLNSGDSLAIKMKHNGLGIENIVTVANGVGLTIKKLY